MRGDIARVVGGANAVIVSIHAPRMRGDPVARHEPDRGAVSIHAPRMRGDVAVAV